MDLVSAAAAIVIALTPGAPSSWTAQWIWTEPPHETNYFRRTFDLPSEPIDGQVAVTADNIFDLYVNGEHVGGEANWTTLERYDVTDLLVRGRNVIAVKAVDPGADVGALLLECGVTMSDGSVVLLATGDGSWRLSLEEQAGWTAVDFDDGSWKSPKVYEPPPMPPWGGFEHPSLLPEVPAELISLDWPAETPLGEPFTVEAKVRLPRSPVTVGPVGLRLEQFGETVYEQLYTPHLPVSEWPAGEVVSLSFADVRLPIYCPQRMLDARVVIAGTGGTGTVKVAAGKPRAARGAPVVSISRLSLRGGVGRTLGVNASAVLAEESPRGFARDRKVHLRLFRGRELWYAADLAPSVPTSAWEPGRSYGLSYSVILPDLPAGDYEGELSVHTARMEGPCTAAVGLKQLGDPRRPMGYGTFVDYDDVPHRWYVNHGGTMIWDGEPYVPVGAMYLSTFFGGFNALAPQQAEKGYRNDLEHFALLRAAGFTELYLNPCCEIEDRPAWVWQRTLDMFEENGFIYGWQMTSPPGPLRAWDVAAGSYRIDAPESGAYEVTLRSGWFGRLHPDCRVRWALFDESTAEFISHGYAATRPEGEGLHVTVEVEVPEGADGLIHLIPEYQFRGDIHDYWEGVNDEYLANLTHFYSLVRPGPNLRLILDPLDNEQSWRDMPKLLPHSDAFRAMLAEYLRDRYGTVAALRARWGILDERLSYDSASRLVPLGTVGDVGWAMDDGTSDVYRVDLTVSEMWMDVVEMRDLSMRDLNNAAADAIKASMCIPIVLKLTDTNSFTNDRTYGGFDGVGMEAYGTTTELVRGCGGGVFSRSQQANRTIWELVTETGRSASYVGYASPYELVRELASMVEAGAKGTWYFYLNAGGDRPGQGFFTHNLFGDERQLQWMGCFSEIMKSADALVDYVPTMDWLYPGVFSGVDGFGRVDPSFHGQIPSQSLYGSRGGWSTPVSVLPPGRAIVSLEDAPATMRWGDEFARQLDMGRPLALVGVRRDLGVLPTDRWYTDEYAQVDKGRLVQILSPPPGAQITAALADGRPYGFRHGSLEVLAVDDWEWAARELTTPWGQRHFIRDVLGVQLLPLGPAYEALHFGQTTYVWNMGESESTITVDVGEVATVELPDGGVVLGGGVVELPLPGGAAAGAIIRGEAAPVFARTDEGNLREARRRHAAAAVEARSVGMVAREVPESETDWAGIYAEAERLQTEARSRWMTAKLVRLSDVKIDGDLSEWGAAQVLRVAAGDEKGPGRADYAGARFAAGWSDAGLYVAADVSDADIINMYDGGAIWNGDGFELFIETDVTDDRTTNVYDIDTFQYLFSPTNRFGESDVAVGGNPRLPWGYSPEAIEFAVAVTDGGWVIEAFIPSSEMGGWVPAEGAEIGFDIQLDISHSRERSQYHTWRGDGLSRQRLAFGRAELVR